MPRALKTLTVETQPWPRAIRVQGSLVADERAVIGAKVAGRVREVRVDLGSEIGEGEVLVTLDKEEFEWRRQQAAAQLEQARAKLGLRPGESAENLDLAQVPAVQQERVLVDEARSNLGRARTLWSTKAISVEQLQEREATLAVAEARYRSALNDVTQQVALVGVRAAELELARQSLKDAEIVAPFRGVVQARHVDPGAYLQVGQRVVSLVKIDRLRFRGGVPEREVIHIRMGQAATIEIEGHAQPVRGAEVTRVSPALDSANRSLCVEIDVENTTRAFRAGLFAQATIITEPSARTLAVPSSALGEFAGVEKVWKVKDGQAEPCTVRTGRRDAERVEIVEGLSVGDVVAVEAMDRRGDVGR